MPALASSTIREAGATSSQLGFFAMMAILMRSYAMGAGTYTGLEAVSNGIPVLHEPKVQTAKRTMTYMAFSLSFLAIGLMIGYLLYNVSFQFGKTSNAVFFESLSAPWDHNIAVSFVFLALASEALLLFVAAQTGFLDGLRVIANTAQDRWMPSKFSLLSARLVVKNGILIMSIAAIAVLLFTRGSILVLVILYSINVFITFCLSQAGMVRHWWNVRRQFKGWLKKLFINGVGLALSAFILLSMLIMKFHSGGWITLFITGALVIIAILIKRHYYQTAKLLHRLNSLVNVAESAEESLIDDALGSKQELKPDPAAKTAVLLVSGFNGIGLHTLFGVIRLFGEVFKNFVFIQVGVVYAGNFKGRDEVGKVEAEAKNDIRRYVKFMNKQGFFAEGIFEVGTDVVEEVSKIAPGVLKRFPNAVFFGGQLIFPQDSFAVRFLHNYTVFAMQKKLYREGIPFVILPIRV